MLIIDYLEHWKNTKPDKLAYGFIDSRGQLSATLSYSELFHQVKVYANGICQRTSENERILLALPTGPEFVCLFLAAMYCNRIPVPVCPPARRQGTDQVNHIIRDCEASLYISNNLNEELDNDIPIASPVEIEGNSDINNLAEQISSQIAFLQYTSGSTSAPKGVIVRHENLIANQKIIREAFGHSEQSIGCGWIPLYHDMGLIGSFLQPLFVGFPVYLMSPMTFLQRPRIWFDIITKYKVTTTGGPNFAYDMCFKRLKKDDNPHWDLSSWSVAFNGAESIRLSTLDNFTKYFCDIGFKSQSITPCYGMAEATLMVTCTSLTSDYTTCVPESSANDFLYTSLGKAIGDTEIRIVGKDQKVLPPRLVGEILICGNSISDGYWSNSEENRKSITSLNNKTYFRTGDLGFCDKDGNLYVTGRVKETIILDGRNYYQTDIKECLDNAHPALRNNHMVAFNVDEISSNHLVIVHEVERRFFRELKSIKADVETTIRQIIFSTMGIQVKNVILTDANIIPKTTSGKIQVVLARNIFIKEILSLLEEPA